MANTVNTTQQSFVGVACYSETGSALGNRYFITGASGVSPGSGGVWYTGTITGTAASGNELFAVGTKYVQIFILMGSNSPVGAWTTVFSTPEMTEVTPVQYGGTGANLLTTGGTSNLVKQSGVGAPFTVGPLTSTEVLVGFTGTKDSTTVARGDGTMAKAVTADWSVGTKLLFTSTTSLGAGREVTATTGGLSVHSASGTTVDLAIGGTAYLIQSSGRTTLAGANGLAFSATGSITSGNREIVPTSVGVGINTPTTTALYGTIGGNAAYKVNATNAAFGYQAGNALNTSTLCALFGYAAGLNTTAGTGLLAVGAYAMGSGVVTGSNYSVAVGYQSLYNLTSGVANIGIGYGAGAALTTPNNNICIGQNTMLNSASQPGDANIAVGTNSSRYLAGGAAYNTTVGYQAFGSSAGPSGSYNSVYGTDASYSSTTGSGKVSVGYRAGFLGASNDGTVAIGYQAGYSNTVSGSVYVGYQAGYASVGSGIVAIGTYAGITNTSGQNLTLVGHQAGYTGSTNSYVTAIGFNALYYNTANNNTAVGAEALLNNSTGYGNSAVGYGALYTNNTGYYNTAMGHWAGYSSVTSSYNVFIGAFAGYQTNGSDGNTYVGAWTGTSVSNGYYNTLLGCQTGASLTSAYGSTLIGVFAGLELTTGLLCTAVGKDALYSSQTDNYNTAIGDSALRLTAGGYNNTALGNSAGYGNVTGPENVYVGFLAGVYNNGSYNTTVGAYAGQGASGVSEYAYTISIGHSALYYLETGFGNVAVGYASLQGVTTGQYNTALGYMAGRYAVSSSENVFVGREAGLNSTGSGNVYVGSQAGLVCTSGAGNTCVGGGAGQGDFTLCTYVGSYSGGYATGTASGTQNASLGSYSLHSATSSADTTAVGFGAGYNVSSGSSNTLVGKNSANTLTTGSNCTVVGANCDVLSATADYQVNIGNAFEKRPVSREIVVRTEATAYANSASYNLAGSYTDQCGYFTVFRKKSGVFTSSKMAFDASNTVYRVSGDTAIKDTAGGAPGANDIRFTLASGTMTITVGSTGACDIGIIFTEVIQF